MKGYSTAGLLIIGIFSLVLIAAPQTGSGSEPDSVVYLGNQWCSDCHVEAYRLWLGSPHSRTWVQLHSRNAMVVALAEGWKEGDPMPTETGLCLGCHAIKTEPAVGTAADNIQVQEGVQCEACHGDAGKRTRTVAGGDSLIVDHDRLVKPSGETCLKCHAIRPSHSYIKARPWDYADRWKRIQHGMEE